jgi:hypothetical protein
MICKTFDNIPQLDDVIEKIKDMTPLVREWLVEYMQYTAIALAQDSIDKEDKREIRGWFAIIHKLMQVFQSLKTKK